MNEDAAEMFEMMDRIEMKMISASSTGQNIWTHYTTLTLFVQMMLYFDGIWFNIFFWSFW